MSTKSTLAHGNGYHLYRDLFENDRIWLMLDGQSGGLQYEATELQVTVAIPREVWDVIRACKLPPDLYPEDERSRQQ